MVSRGLHSLNATKDTNEKIPADAKGNRIGGDFLSLKIYGNEKLEMRGGCRTPRAARLFVAQSVDGVHFGGLVGGVVAEEL